MNRLLKIFIITILILSVAAECEDKIPAENIVLTVQEYDSLKSAVKIIEVKIPPNYDSVNTYWNEKLQLDVAQYIQEIQGLQTGHLSYVAETNVAHKKAIAEKNDTISNLETNLLTTRILLQQCREVGIIGVPLDTIVSYQLPVQLFPDTIRVDASPSGMAKENLSDGILYRSKNNQGTRWGASGYPHSVAFSWAEPVFIDSVLINVYYFDEGYTHNFRIYSWGDKILESETFPTLYSRYYLGIKTSQVIIEFTGGQNNWTDIGEIKIIGRLLNRNN